MVDAQSAESLKARCVLWCGSSCVDPDGVVTVPIHTKELPAFLFAGRKLIPWQNRRTRQALRDHTGAWCLSCLIQMQDVVVDIPYLYATTDWCRSLQRIDESTVSQTMFCIASQYACMFIAAGESGNVRKIMASVAAARKVFRILRVRPRTASWRVALQQHADVADVHCDSDEVLCYLAAS